MKSSRFLMNWEDDTLEWKSMRNKTSTLHDLCLASQAVTIGAGCFLEERG